MDDKNFSNDIGFVYEELTGCPIDKGVEKKLRQRILTEIKKEMFFGNTSAQSAYKRVLESVADYEELVLASLMIATAYGWVEGRKE